MSDFYKDEIPEFEASDKDFSHLEKLHHDSYDFAMPEDIESHLSYFGRKCFDPESPVLAFMAACHDYRTGKPINGLDNDNDDKAQWDSILKEHFSSIKSLLSKSMDFIKQMPDEDEWLDGTTRILMSQCMYRSSISAYDLENTIRHQVRNYMATHPGYLLVHNIVEKMGGSNMNWYKRAQEEDDGSEDMRSAMKETMEKMEIQPIIDSVDNESSIYGVSLSPSDEQWVFNRAKSLALGGGKINPKEAKDMGLAVVIGRWTNNHPEDMLVKVNGSGKYDFEVYLALMKKWIVNNSSSFNVAEKIYLNAIKPIGGKYPVEDVAELISSEMQFLGAN